MVRRARGQHDTHMIQPATRVVRFPARPPAPHRLESSAPRMAEPNMRNLPGAMT